MSWQDQMLSHSPPRDQLPWTHSFVEETTTFSEELPYRESKKWNLTSQLTSDPKRVDVPLSSQPGTYNLICKPMKLVSGVAVDDGG